MLNVDKATARLQALWDIFNPDDPRIIRKAIVQPKSRGAVGWTWIAIATDSKWIDLGYTEKQAAKNIRLWNTPLAVAMRKLNSAVQQLVNNIK